MNCSKCLKLLPLYAGGDLDEKRASAVAAHLADCKACEAELARYGGAMSALKAVAVGEEDLPAVDRMYWPEVESKLRGRRLDVEHLHATRYVAWRSARVLAQAALVLIVAGAVAWYGLTTGTGTTLNSAEPPTLAKPGLKPPVIVVIDPDGGYGQADVTTVPVSDEVIYTDTGRIDRPGQRRIIRQMIAPASYDEEEPF